MPASLNSGVGKFYMVIPGLVGFYTYLWLREDGTPYYVGKGKGRRAFVGQGHTVSPPLQGERILIQEFSGELEAFEGEKFLISYYGRRDLGTGCLMNMTDGGEGTVGMSEATRRKRSESNRGKHNFSRDTRRRMREVRLEQLRKMKYVEGVV